MKNYSPESAMTEHLLTGHSASSIEATLLFGIRNPNAFFSRLRKEGHRIQRKEVPMVKVIRRLNEYSQFLPPENLPMKDLKMTEYWIER